MARLGISPVFKAFDSDGSVLNAGTVETYITSTSTPKNTWSDQAETTDAASSFTLDSNGEAVRYFDTDAAYKLIIKDSSGTTVRTIDPYVPVPIMSVLDDDLDVNGNSIISSSNGDIAITPNGTGDVVLDGLKWPQADGTNGQVLKTDGAAQLSWVAASTDLVNDTSPQLGADLDTNSYNVSFDTGHGILDENSQEQLLFTTTASAINYLNVANSIVGLGPTISAAGDDANIDLNLTAKGSGNVSISGLKYPNADGSANEIIKTDGAGSLSFGNIAVASQAQMESASSTSVYVTPGRTQYHPGTAKGWVKMDVAGTADASHNVTSITDNGTGDFTVNWDTDFSSANFSVTANALASVYAVVTISGNAAGTTQIVIRNSSGTATETSVTGAFVVALGDQ